MKHIITVIAIILLAGCAKQGLVQESEMDSPMYHYNIGKNQIDKGNIADAQRAFDRAIGLDKKFALAYGGKALIFAMRSNFKQARKTLNKGFDYEKKNPELFVYKGRIIVLEKDDDWLQDALKAYDKALKLKANYIEAEFYKAEAYREGFKFIDAGKGYQNVITTKGKFTSRANQQYELVQKIQRAAPGTIIGKKIALVQEITRAEYCVLLAEELKLADLYKRYNTEPIDPLSEYPADVKNHWAKQWISIILDHSVLSLFPDGFLPDRKLDRITFAYTIESIITVLKREKDISIKFIGEESRFTDLSSEHYAYNSAVLCVEYGFLQKHLMTNEFRPNDNLSGVDVLLAIREFQNALAIHF